MRTYTINFFSSLCQVRVFASTYTAYVQFDCLHIKSFCNKTVILLYNMTIICVVDTYTWKQGSAAFVYGWVMFTDRFSNGALNEVIQQLSPPE